MKKVDFFYHRLKHNLSKWICIYHYLQRPSVVSFLSKNISTLFLEKKIITHKQTVKMNCLSMWLRQWNYIKKKKCRGLFHDFNVTNCFEKKYLSTVCFLTNFQSFYESNVKALFSDTQKRCSSYIPYLNVFIKIDFKV